MKLLADFIGTNTLLDVTPNIRKAATESSYPKGNGSHGARQLVRTNHKQGYDPNQEELGKSNVEHGTWALFLLDGRGLGGCLASFLR